MKKFARITTGLLLVVICIFIAFGIIAFFQVNETKRELTARQASTKAIVCFIDDDSGKFVPDIWGPIIDSTNIKMGFACITGFMGDVHPYSEVFEPMDSSYLRILYNRGHDIYSHSFSHQEFFVDSVSTEMIDFQCKKSKEWMLSHGFARNSNIIVYPGGLGRGSWGGAKKYFCLI